MFPSAVFLICAGVGLAGCSTQGDFGEVNSSLVRDGIHDWVGRDVANDPAHLQSALPLTDDERELRDLAYPLLEPPYNRQKFHSVASEYGLTPQTLRESADRTVYFSHLIAADDRSPAARYAQLIDDIRNDITRMPEFFETAGRVLDLDQKRARSVAYVAGSGDDELTRKLARERIQENARIVAMVRTSLTQRGASYRFALARLAVMTPLPRVVETEQVLNSLQAQIAHYQYNTAPTWSRPRSLAYSP